MSSVTAHGQQYDHGQIYKSLLVPFSNQPTQAESTYRAANLQKTRGTLFIIPPAELVLREAYNAPPRPKSRMSSGAVALCKHFERIPDSPRSKRDQTNGQRHPFWSEPRGNNDDKTRTAALVLDQMLQDACWRNVMLLHRGVAVYEIRNARGWGMRWTLAIEEVVDGIVDHDGETATTEESGSDTVSHLPSSADTRKTEDLSILENDTPPVNTNQSTHDSGLNNTTGSTTSPEHDQDPNLRNWMIKSVTFRGLLEPIEGMDHELLP